MVSARKQLILHIPHCSTYIPQEIRQTLLLNDDELKQELYVMTDHYIDDLYKNVLCDKQNNSYSRLVFDPERYREDKDEELAPKGMGAIYTKTSLGTELRRITPYERENLMHKYYDVYHEQFNELVERKLNEYGQCLIVDAHSFPSKPLPYELDQGIPRPDICIGTDSFHTPENLQRSIGNFFVSHGFSIKLNSPFSGTIVPLQFYRCIFRHIRTANPEVSGQ